MDLSNLNQEVEVDNEDTADRIPRGKEYGNNIISFIESPL